MNTEKKITRRELRKMEQEGKIIEVPFMINEYVEKFPIRTIVKVKQFSGMNKYYQKNQDHWYKLLYVEAFSKNMNIVLL